MWYWRISNIWNSRAYEYILTKKHQMEGNLAVGCMLSIKYLEKNLEIMFNVNETGEFFSDMC